MKPILKIPDGDKPPLGINFSIIFGKGCAFPVKISGALKRQVAFFFIFVGFCLVEFNLHEVIVVTITGNVKNLLQSLKGWLLGQYIN